MAISSATVTMNLADLLGVDFDIRRTKVWVSTNIPGNAVIDTVGNQIRLGAGNVSLNADGTASLSTWIPGAGANPASWQTYVNVDYRDSGSRERVTRTFGPFTITGNADLADLVAEQEIPPTYLAQVSGTLAGYVTDAKAARDAAQALVLSDLGTTDGQTRALVQNPASQTAVALSASIEAEAARATTRVYDDFTGQSNGAIAGRVPIKGAAWRTTGANPSAVVSGAATSTGTGYMYQLLTDKVRIVMCEVAFTSSSPSMTMAVPLTDDTHMVENMGAHFNFGPLGFNVTSRRDAEATFVSYPGLFGTWQRPLATDGSETARFWLLIRRDTITIIGPDGIPRSVVSPLVGQLAGNTVFWEPNAGAQMKTCMAVASASGPQQTLLDMLLDHAVSPLLDDKGAVNGNLGGYGQVKLGLDPSGFPSITLGAPTIYTRLTTAVTIADTTINTADKIPGGSSVVIETGNATETVTRTSGGPGGTGPFTGVLSAGATKAHPVNSVVIATPPAGRTATFLWNPENQTLTLPAGVILPSLVYFPGQTAYLQQSTSGVVQLGGFGTGKGALRLAEVTTAGRPPAGSSGRGACVYDTTLSKPVWSDGTVWRDAAGTAV